MYFSVAAGSSGDFWATGFKYKYFKDSPNYIFIPEYIFEKNKIREHQRALKARVDKLIRPAKHLSDIEKEKYIHDFVCENVRYDKLKKAYSHEIIGPLGQGVGVCEGIAKSVKILCDALNLWCIIAICGNNPEKVLSTDIPGILSGWMESIIIWMPHLTTVSGAVEAVHRRFVMIISIWTIKLYSGIMSR